MTNILLDKIDPCCAFYAFLKEYPEYNDPKHITDEEDELSFSEPCLKAYLKYAEAVGAITPHTAEDWLAAVNRGKEELLESNEDSIPVEIP